MLQNPEVGTKASSEGVHWGPIYSLLQRDLLFFFTYISAKTECTCLILLIMNLPTDMGPYGLLNHKQCPVIYLILTLQFSNL